jgi:hypothetical protein
MKVVEFTISCNNAYTTSYQSPCYNGIWHRVDAFYTHRKVAKNARVSPISLAESFRRGALNGFISLFI